jgi:hypothetical protein
MGPCDGTVSCGSLLPFCMVDIVPTAPLLSITAYVAPGLRTGAQTQAGECLGPKRLQSTDTTAFDDGGRQRVRVAVDCM